MRKLLLYLLCAGMVASCTDKEQDGMGRLAGTWRMTSLIYDGVNYCPGCSTTLRFQHCAKHIETCKAVTYTYTLTGDTLVGVEAFSLSPDVRRITIGGMPYRIARLTRKELVLTDTSGVLYRADYVRDE